MGLVLSFALGLTCAFGGAYLMAFESDGEYHLMSAFVGLLFGGCIGLALFIVGFAATTACSHFLAPEPAYAESFEVEIIDAGSNDNLTAVVADGEDGHRSMNVPRALLSFEVTDDGNTTLDVYKAWNPFTYAMDYQYILHVPKGSVIGAVSSNAE